MALTYDELIRRVPLWLYASNRDLVDEMPAIVEQAEDQLLQIMDHDLFQSVVTGLSVSEANPVMDLTGRSPRVLEVRSVALAGDDAGTWDPGLQRRDYQYLTSLITAYRRERPRYYAEKGSTLRVQVFPTPDRTYAVEILANVEMARLGPSQQTSILTEQFPRAMEKSAMRQAALFMKNVQDAQTYEAEMMAAVAEANAQVARRRRDEVGSKPVDTNNTKGT